MNLAFIKRKKVWIPIVVVLVIVATVVAFGPYIYRDQIAREAPATPSVEVTGNTDTPLTNEEMIGDWVAADGTYAGYRVNEVLRGVPVTVVGRTSQVEANVTLGESSVEVGKIIVDMASVATDQPSRDSYFREPTLATATNKTSQFELTKPVQLNSPLVAGEKQAVDLVGKLTIHGVSREVTAKSEVGFDGRLLKVAGSIPMVFADYDVQAPNLGFVTVEDRGSVEFLIVLAHK